MPFATLWADLAVLNIFRVRAVPPLGRLEIGVLRAQWPRYALRARDLDASLARLEGLGLLEMDAARGETFIVLTETGHDNIHSSLGRIESLLLWPRRVRRWLQLRRRAPARDRRRQRQSTG